MFPTASARCGAGDGRIHERAPDSCGQGRRGGHLPARIERHSRPGQPLALAGGQPRVRRLPIGLSAPQEPFGDRHGDAGPPALSPAGRSRLPDRLGAGPGPPGPAGDGWEPGGQRSQRHAVVILAAAGQAGAGVAVVSPYRSQRHRKGQAGLCQSKAQRGRPPVL